MTSSQDGKHDKPTKKHDYLPEIVQTHVSISSTDEDKQPPQYKSKPKYSKRYLKHQQSSMRKVSAFANADQTVTGDYMY